ncbi:hypothetical protein [Erwinia sp.]|uniref:hypothetical protein n=1 Tax=Erwinia citreus TaxID=558 RepID=UPI003C720876
MMAVLFIPSLISLLVKAETQKGSGLTQQEVEHIRENATCISVPDDLVRGMDPSRGYRDIDPSRCWEAWLDYRSPGLAQTA